jgi:signal transduction histidine kinase
MKNHNLDVMRLSQVLTNLLTNAIKFSHRFGKILVIANANKLIDNTDNIEIRVVDSGIGIS